MKNQGLHSLRKNQVGLAHLKSSIACINFDISHVTACYKLYRLGRQVASIASVIIGGNNLISSLAH